MTFDETPPPSKTSLLVDDDLDEDEAIKVTKKKNLVNDIEDETFEVDKIVNIKESKNHPLSNFKLLLLVKVTTAQEVQRKYSKLLLLLELKLLLLVRKLVLLKELQLLVNIKLMLIEKINADEEITT
ncbi:hypothetical protein Tco_0648741 [Tanacetum coccineum]